MTERTGDGAGVGRFKGSTLLGVLKDNMNNQGKVVYGTTTQFGNGAW